MVRGGALSLRRSSTRASGASSESRAARLRSKDRLAEGIGLVSRGVEVRLSRATLGSAKLVHLDSPSNRSVGSRKGW